MYRNNIAYRVTAFALSLLMALTSIGFAVDMHYCQGKLKSYSFFGEAASCHELAKAKTNCTAHIEKEPLTKGCTITKKKCCENKTLYFQLDQNQEKSTDEWVISPITQLFTIAYVATFVVPFQVEHYTQQFFHYTPPLIRFNRSILFQSFLL